MPNPQEIRVALERGILDGAGTHIAADEVPRLKSAVCDPLSDRREELGEHCLMTDDTASAYALGVVAAATLTSQELKIGDRRKLTNAQLVHELANQVLIPGNNLEISIALGGSEDAPSARLLSYVSPMLEMGSLFARQGLVIPKLRVVAAHAVSSSLNGLDAKCAAQRAQQACMLIERLAQTYYPECSAHVSIEHLDMDEVIEKGHIADSRYLLGMIATGSPGNNVITATLHKLLKRATKRHALHADEAGQAFVLAGYAAAHGITYHNYRYPAITSAIKIGGAGETPFNIIQQHMTERAKQAGEHTVNNRSGNPVLVNLQTKAGVIPPYYSQHPEEITVDTPRHRIPTIEGARSHYTVLGLQSGEDFQYLPSRLAADQNCLKLLLGDD